MSEAIMYTQEQMDIAILKNNQGNLSKMLERIEGRFDKLEQKVDSHFHWTLGWIFGMYPMGLIGLIGALGHAYGWF